MSQFVDITGKVYGKLIALAPTFRTKNNGYKWKFKCECGNIIETIAANVKNGKISSCGCSKAANARRCAMTGKNNLIGQRFGRLVVLKVDDKKYKEEL